MNIPSVKLDNPMRSKFESFIFANAQVCDLVVEPDTAKGQTIVICGAGPSLRDTADEWTRRGDQVWGCNSAAMWLHENGYPITHAFTVDQTPGMLEEWQAAPPVEYLLASSCHPHLAPYLLARDRTVRFFHNFLGIRKPPVEYCECGHDHSPPVVEGAAHGNCTECDCTDYQPRRMSYEDWLYALLYPATCRSGTALNSVMRAWDVAQFVGAEETVILGADCAIKFDKPPPKGALVGSPEHIEWLTKHGVMHADGSHPLRSGATPITFDGTIDGRLWVTKPDMAVTAYEMEKLRRMVGRKKLRIVGDVLPNAIQNKPDAWLERLPRFGSEPDA